MSAETLPRSPSTQLELGRCGEYYAVFSLIKQGFAAFLSDQGLSYDVVVDVEGRLLRGQVKATRSRSDYGKSKDVYRFSTRSGKGSNRKASVEDCDFYALVCVEDEKVAFFSTKKLASKKNQGAVKQCVELRSRDVDYPGRTYSSGKVRKWDFIMMMEDFADFNGVITDIAEGS